MSRLSYSIYYLPLTWCLLVAIVCNVHAQGDTGNVSGKITDVMGNPLLGATVVLKNTTRGTVTDAEGQYRIDNVPAGSQVLEVRFLGYITQEKTVTVKAGRIAQASVSLEEDASTLDAVEVNDQQSMRTIREQAFTVSAIDTKKYQNLNLDLNQILNRSTGARVREEGGLGSNFTFSLNGLSGKQVKFFLDGIPMDNFGSSLSLNNIPANMADHIEVYKGVVPIHLGSDALGGAVNVVTNQNLKNFVDASYSYGSFNTHRAAITGRVTSAKTGLTLGASAFYNYSDNDYRVKVEVPGEGGTLGDPEWVTRFHDGYHSSTVQVEGGITNKPWADKLLAGVIVSGNKKELQTGLRMDQVIGQAYTTDDVVISTLKYKKEDLLTKGLTVSAYATYNHAETMVVDTSSREYDWRGNYTVRNLNQGAEIEEKTLFKFNDRVVLTSANVMYELNEKHTFSFNYIYNRFRREGEDPVARFAIPFSKPNILAKNILGLSYELKALEGKFRGTAFAKYFLMHGEVVSAEYGSYDPKTTNFDRPGYGIAGTYFFTPMLQVKASYENTTRLPEGEEIFGNGLLIRNNADLKAETSQNVNLEGLYTHTRGRHRWDFDLAFVYRLPENLIRYEATGIVGNYVNQRQARVAGVESTVRYTYKKWLYLEVNGTFQDMINTTRHEPADNPAVSYIYRYRLPNIPYLFGNVMAGFMFDDIGIQGSRLSINWYTSYVEAFYLKWPAFGGSDDKAEIPQQLSHSMSVGYSLDKNRYSISLECNNLADAMIYDNYALQKPGRSFAVKLRYCIFK